jgi:hypothetical protein
MMMIHPLKSDSVQTMILSRPRWEGKAAGGGDALLNNENARRVSPAAREIAAAKKRQILKRHLTQMFLGI